MPCALTRFLSHIGIHRHPPMHLVLLRTGCVSEPRWYLKIANVSPGIRVAEFSVSCDVGVHREITPELLLH